MSILSIKEHAGKTSSTEGQVLTWAFAAVAQNWRVSKCLKDALEGTLLCDLGKVWKIDASPRQMRAPENINHGFVV